MKHRTLFAIATIAFATAAHADEGAFVNGNTLLSRLQSSSPTERSFGIGYVAAVADAFDGDTFCLPPGVNIRQMADLTQRMIESRPESRHLSGAAFTAAALMQAFPCGERKQKRGSL